MTDVEIQRMRANVYREELLHSHDVIDKLEKEIKELKAELMVTKRMLDAVLD